MVILYQTPVLNIGESQIIIIFCKDNKYTFKATRIISLKFNIYCFCQTQLDAESKIYIFVKIIRKYNNNQKTRDEIIQNKEKCNLIMPTISSLQSANLILEHPKCKIILGLPFKLSREKKSLTNYKKAATFRSQSCNNDN